MRLNGTVNSDIARNVDDKLIIDSPILDAQSKLCVCYEVDVTAADRNEKSDFLNTAIRHNQGLWYQLSFGRQC
jgi:hypothetical protein